MYYKTTYVKKSDRTICETKWLESLSEIESATPVGYTLDRVESVAEKPECVTAYEIAMADFWK